MRYIILLAALAFNFTVSAQPKEKLILAQLNDVKTFSENFASFTKKLMDLQVDTIAKKEFRRIYADQKSGITIEFLRSKDDTYSFGQITGDFDNLFMIWKAYFDPGANEQTILSKGNGTPLQVSSSKGNLSIGFNKYHNGWMISTMSRY